MSGSTCANTCPLGQYGNSTSRLCETCTGYCLTCSNSTYCLSCTSNFLLNGACVAANLCPARQYADMSTLSCKSCSAICLTCNYKSSLCTSCFVNSSFPYLLDGNCLANCPLVYYYASLVTGSCQQCAIPCSTCSDAITCLSCLDGYIYSSGKCSGSCQAGSYFSGIDTGCLACQVNCLVCTVNTFCQICFSSYYIYVTSAGNNQCVKPCPSLYYPN